MRNDGNIITAKERIMHVCKHINPLLLVVGVLVIAFSWRIQSVLHWVVGSATLATGLIIAFTGIREYAKRKSVTRLTVASVLLVMGIVIMAQRENAVGTIMIIWGFIGLSNGCYRLFEYVKSDNKKSVYGIGEMLISLVDAALGITLLINPYRDIQLHIVLLGVELLMLSVKSFDYRVLPEKKNEMGAEYAEEQIYSIYTPKNEKEEKDDHIE